MSLSSKILLFSDPHLDGSEDSHASANPAHRLRRALEQALARHPDAAHLVLPGDLSNGGDVWGYEFLRALCAEYDLPCTFLMGNEEDRGAFASVFPDVATDQNGFYQSVLTFGGHTVICLDTLDPEVPTKHGGLLCDQRLDWLRAALTDAADQQVTVVMHHPPAPLGMPRFDALGLANGTEVSALLSSAGVRLVIAGHIHRSIQAVVDGLPIATLKSTGFGLMMQQGDAPLARDPADPGAYGVLLLTEHGPILHHEEITWDVT